MSCPFLNQQHRGEKRAGAWLNHTGLQQFRDLLLNLVLQCELVAVLANSHWLSTRDERDVMVTIAPRR